MTLAIDQPMKMYPNRYDDDLEDQSSTHWEDHLVCHLVVDRHKENSPRREARTHPSQLQDWNKRRLTAYLDIYIMKEAITYHKPSSHLALALSKVIGVVLSL